MIVFPFFLKWLAGRASNWASTPELKRIEAGWETQDQVTQDQVHFCSGFQIKNSTSISSLLLSDKSRRFYLKKVLNLLHVSIDLLHYAQCKNFLN